MAKVTFEVGDQFVIVPQASATSVNQQPTFGVVISSGGDAVLINGQGGRAGWTISRGPVPERATPLHLAGVGVNHEVKFALNVARAVARAAIKS